MQLMPLLLEHLLATIWLLEDVVLLKLHTNSPLRHLLTLV